MCYFHFEGERNNTTEIKYKKIPHRRNSFQIRKKSWNEATSISLTHNMTAQLYGHKRVLLVK
jgi:hypothetical protein